MALGPQWQHAWLVIASFLAGALNAMAGGGSFLSFPALLGVGVLPIQANATNTVALWPGQFTSIAAYWQDLKANVRLVIPIVSAALLGGVTGAVVLLRPRHATFMALVPCLLLLAAGLFAASGPVSGWLQRNRVSVAGSHPHLAPLWIGVVVVCFYIGYFGAGDLWHPEHQPDQCTESDCYGYGQRDRRGDVYRGKTDCLEILPADDDCRGSGWLSGSTVFTRIESAVHADVGGRDWPGNGGLLFLEAVCLEQERHESRRHTVYQRTRCPEAVAGGPPAASRGYGAGSSSGAEDHRYRSGDRLEGWPT